MATPNSRGCFHCGPQVQDSTNGAARVELVGRGAPGREQDLDKEPREQPAQTMAE
jgi:hypothetical protein